MNDFGDFMLNVFGGMGGTIFEILRVIIFIALALLFLRLFIGILQGMHLVLTLPLRRAERARRFLRLLESILKQGKPVEETLISLARTRDLSMGVGFHLLTAWLEKGLSLDAALEHAPHFLSPQITAMLRAGCRIGDLKKVLPACHQLLKDSLSQTRGALNYLILITFVVTPLGLYVYTVLNIFIFPKFMAVSAGMGIKSGVGLLTFLAGHFPLIIWLQTIFLVLIWGGVLLYVAGTRAVEWFPVLEVLYVRVPWRRQRMQRDFSTMLAVLLDAGMPEPEALTLAADCSANSVFRQRAVRAVAALGQGFKLPDAVHFLDEAGEFRWRLRNALAGPGGFFRALAGWHDALDARAFQQEQAAAHVVTTALVICSGVFVGAICFSVFSFLVSLIKTGVLW